MVSVFEREIFSRVISRISVGGTCGNLFCSSVGWKNQDEKDKKSSVSSAQNGKAVDSSSFNLIDSHGLRGQRPKLNRYF